MKEKKKTIKISEEAHKYLINASNRIGMALKRKITMDEAVKYSSLSLELLVAVAKLYAAILKDQPKAESTKFFKAAEGLGKSVALDIPNKEKAEVNKLILYIFMEALPPEVLLEKNE